MMHAWSINWRAQATVRIPLSAFLGLQTQATFQGTVPAAARLLDSTPQTMTLTKRDLVKRISAETDLLQAQIFDVVQKTLDQIAAALARGDKVELRNFGVFHVRIRQARVGRNPHQPATEVSIPPRALVKFKAGKEMRAEVFKLSPNGARQVVPPGPQRDPLAAPSRRVAF